MSTRILFKAKPGSNSAGNGQASPTFFFDPHTQELHKDEVKLVQLSPQAAVILRLLAEGLPEVVDHNSIENALWPDEKARSVNSRQAIRAHIGEIRELLCDSADHPRFIETVRWVGYRFIGVRLPDPAPVTLPANIGGTQNADSPPDVSHSTTNGLPVAASVQPPPESAPPGESEIPTEPSLPRSWRHAVSGKRIAGAAAALALLLTVFLAQSWKSQTPPVLQPQPYPIPRVLAGLSRPGAVRSVALPSAPARSVLSRDGNLLYVALPEAGAVAVVNLLEAKVDRLIPVGGAPHIVSMAPDGRRLYLCDGRDGVYVVDLAAERAHHIPTGGPVNDIQLSPDGQRLYLAMRYEGLKRMDTKTEAVAPIPGIRCPQNLTSDPSQNRLWISSRCGGGPGGRDGHDRIQVLDYATEKNILSVGDDAPIVGGHIAASPAASQVWIDGSDACSSTRYDHKGCPAVPSGVLHAFALASGQHLAALAVPASGAVGFSPDGRHSLFGTNSRLLVFDTVSIRPTEAAETNATWTHFSPSRPELYTISYDPNEVRIVKLPPAECQDPVGAIDRHLSGDGVGTDTRSAGHVTLQGGASYGAGILGQAFSFDGDRAFLALDGAYGPTIKAGHTSSMWAHPSRSGREEILVDHVRADGSPHWSIRRRPDTRIELRIVLPSGETRQMISSDGTPAGVWTSIALTATSEKLTVYLNGAHQSELLETFPDETPGARIRIGSGFRGHPYAGLIDEILVQATLSETDLRTQYDRLRRCSTMPW